jgi:hypothetical protein
VAARKSDAWALNYLAQEFSLRSGSDPFPEELLHGLPFGMVDVQDNWIPDPTSYQPNIGITRIFWNKDLESIKERYQEAKEMLAADEWLKGLESERDSYLQDIERIERFEQTRLPEVSTAGELWRHLRASWVASNTGMFDISCSGFVSKAAATMPCTTG